MDKQKPTIEILNLQGTSKLVTINVQDMTLTVNEYDGCSGLSELLNVNVKSKYIFEMKANSKRTLYMF